MVTFVCRVVCEDRNFYIYKSINGYWIQKSRANPTEPLQCYPTKEAAIDAIELRYHIDTIIKESSKSALEAFLEAQQRMKHYYSIDRAAIKNDLEAAINRGANTLEATAKGNAVFRVWLHLISNDRLTAVPHMRYTSLFSSLDTLVSMGWIKVDDEEKHILIL